ncbi:MULTISPECIES: FAD-binding oxidoreductase [unclassified Microbispora]|uniref:FAD-binding oxidoreductase n=1 Tax=unclassified Microbispora TaxID=2614687 RepID=UPI001603B435|nr:MULTISPECIES: FAD-binding protein [unclassified Microbispora]
MTVYNRRGFLAGAAAAGAGLASGVALGSTPASAGTTGTRCVPEFGPFVVKPGDPRFDSMRSGHNMRFTGAPDQVTVVGSAEQVVDAVGAAVAAGKRLVARSGGHCMEDFTTTSDIKAVVDLSQMTAVYHDARRGAFAVEPGALVGEVAETLFKGWGVMIPFTGCATVGIGGHIPGGGYGFFSRKHGLSVDHLNAVEVVTVDASGRPRVIVATDSPSDPNRDLFWAHTGGGAGNFGIVTRYWFRTPGVTSTDPTRLLPRIGNQRARLLMWSWDAMTEQAFTTLVGNYCTWYQNNSAPGSPAVNLWGTLTTNHRSAGTLMLLAGVDESVSGGQALLDAHFAAVTSGVGVEPMVDVQETTPWLDPRNWVSDPAGRQKNKTADLRRSYTPAQIATLYRHLSDDSYYNPNALVNITGFGGRINSVASGATAAVHRDSVLRVYFTAGGWSSSYEDEANMAWIRNLYRELYQDTGGVPVPNAVNGGAFINYPDRDLADPAWNTSGTPWHALYYRDNYPRLQRIKRQYDPRNVFRHGLSIGLPS